MKNQFYIPFKNTQFKAVNCFLCGHEIEGETTREHIFPKWLQKQFNLWDQTISITNNSTIQYKNLTVPCCPKCNNKHLSIMESNFQKLLSKGFTHLSAFDEQVIFNWCGKILYATRHKELTLLYDRRKPNLGTIISDDEFHSYSCFQLFLQSIRYKTTWNVKPWSLFIFESQTDDFFYQTKVSYPCLSIKLGKYIIVILFEDNSAIENHFIKFKSIQFTPLSFVQQIEITAYLFYSASIKGKIPYYNSYFIDGHLTVNSSNNIYSKTFNHDDFANYYRLMLLEVGIEFNDVIHTGNGMINTTLIDENNEPLIK
jgi:hypothetical protein